MEKYPNIGLYIGNEYKFYYPKDIMYCRAEGNSTYVHFKNDYSTTSSKKLKDLESILPESLFVRIHHSFIVNLMYVSRYVNDESKVLIMSNGDKLTVSRRKRNDLLSHFIKL